MYKDCPICKGKGKVTAIIRDKTQPMKIRCPRCNYGKIPTTKTKYEVLRKRSVDMLGNCAVEVVYEVKAIKIDCKGIFYDLSLTEEIAKEIYSKSLVERLNISYKTEKELFATEEEAQTYCNMMNMKNEKGE